MMRCRLIVISVMISSGFYPAFAGTIKDVSSLDFKEHSRAALLDAVSPPGAIKEIARQAMSIGSDGQVNQKQLREINATPFEVMDDFQVSSLGHDGNLQLLFRVDYTGRDRPTELLAIFKVGDKLTQSSIYGGEGGFGIGEISSLTEDINHNGKQEIVLVERRLRGLNGERYADSDPAPIVVNIYSFGRQGFRVSNGEFKGYFASSVLPRLQLHLSNLLSQTAPRGDLDQIRQYSKDLSATKESVFLAERMIKYGHY